MPKLSTQDPSSLKNLLKIVKILFAIIGACALCGLFYIAVSIFVLGGFFLPNKELCSIAIDEALKIRIMYDRSIDRYYHQYAEVNYKDNGWNRITMNGWKDSTPSTALEKTQQELGSSTSSKRDPQVCTTFLTYVHYDHQGDFIFIENHLSTDGGKNYLNFSDLNQKLAHYLTSDFDELSKKYDLRRAEYNDDGRFHLNSFYSPVITLHPDSVLVSTRTRSTNEFDSQTIQMEYRHVKGWQITKIGFHTIPY